MRTGVAGGSDLVDANQERVVVAVGADFFDVLEVAGCRAFIPEFVTRTGEKPSRVRVERFLIAFGVHIGKHEDVASRVFHDNRGDEAFGKIECHGRIATPFSCKICLTSGIVISP